ncbi:MAG: hypothetical protein NC311_06645 [Muribaculaceae bacterium]|nr:hypothetical protein [Muribaculaceae bacterium]
MVVMTKKDLDSLTYPAAYTMTKTAGDSCSTTTTIANVIKVDDALYLMMCTATPLYHQEDAFQTMDKRSPTAMLEKFEGFDFVQADLTFTANPTKPEVVRNER